MNRIRQKPLPYSPLEPAHNSIGVVRFSGNYGPPKNKTCYRRPVDFLNGKLDRVRGYSLGANIFVGKPNHLTEYGDAVRLLGHHGAGLRL
jgi:hypothetical protein